MAITSAAHSSNSNPHASSSGGWTIVSSRRRRKQRNSEPPQTQPPTSPPDAPSPWAPLEPSADPERGSKLLHRIRSAVARIERSKFHHRFLSRIRDPTLRSHLEAALASGSAFQMVVYGLGSIESYDSPRLQLALALLIKRELGETVGAIEVFDPVLSATECSVLEALGCSVIPLDERGRRTARDPTLFYMPHCEAALYDNLLSANWAPTLLNRMVVLGNSFAVYGRYVEGMGSGRGSVVVEAAARHVLQLSKYVKEFEMEDGSLVEGIDGEEEEDGDGFFKAFHDISWHFFELDDETDMNAL